MWYIGVVTVEQTGAGALGVELFQVVGLPVVDRMGELVAEGGRRGVCLYLFRRCSGAVSKSFENLDFSEAYRCV